MLHVIFSLNEYAIFYRFRDSRLFVESRRFLPTPPAFGAPVGSDLFSNFAEIFGVKKLDFLGYRVVLFV